MLALMALVLFAAVPVAVGYAVPGATAGRALWLALGAVMAYSQARDAELGGAWVPVAILVLAGLLLVELGRRLRLRRARS